MSRFLGRQIDDLALWSNYIEIPQGAERESHYWPKAVCPNPDHNTGKKHFQVNVNQGLVHCFAECGISGTYLHAIQIIEGCDDKRARKIILGYAGRRHTRVVPDTRRSVVNPSRDDLEFESFIPPVGIEYLATRGISSGSVARWGIGWCPETLRLVIPARDLRRETRFLIKRAVREDQQPKYLYTEGYPKSRLLFGACETRLELIRSHGIVLVEGSLDAVRLHQFDVLYAVATLGTGISRSQAEIVSRLRPRRVYAMFDKDAAGVAGLASAWRQLRGKYPLYVVRYPKGVSDPAEFRSREEVERAIARSVPFRTFQQRVQQQQVRRLISYGSKS
jgi:DNA primase